MRKQRFLVDKSVEIFNVGDEFLVHCFKAHLAARLCTLLKLSSPSDDVQHEVSQEWLKATAEFMVVQTLTRAVSGDLMYSLHRSFLHLGFLYMDLKNVIQRKIDLTSLSIGNCGSLGLSGLGARTMQVNLYT